MQLLRHRPRAAVVPLSRTGRARELVPEALFQSWVGFFSSPGERPLIYVSVVTRGGHTWGSVRELAQPRSPIAASRRVFAVAHGAGSRDGDEDEHGLRPRGAATQTGDVRGGRAAHPLRPCDPLRGLRAVLNVFLSSAPVLAGMPGARAAWRGPPGCAIRQRRQFWVVPLFAPSVAERSAASRASACSLLLRMVLACSGLVHRSSQSSRASAGLWLRFCRLVPWRSSFNPLLLGVCATRKGRNGSPNGAG